MGILMGIFLKEIHFTTVEFYIIQKQGDLKEYFVRKDKK